MSWKTYLRKKGNKRYSKDCRPRKLMIQISKQKLKLKNINRLNFISMSRMNKKKNEVLINAMNFCESFKFFSAMNHYLNYILR